MTKTDTIKEFRNDCDNSLLRARWSAALTDLSLEAGSLAESVKKAPPDVSDERLIKILYEWVTPAYHKVLARTAEVKKELNRWERDHEPAQTTTAQRLIKKHYDRIDALVKSAAADTPTDTPTCRKPCNTDAGGFIEWYSDHWPDYTHCTAEETIPTYVGIYSKGISS